MPSPSDFIALEALAVALYESSRRADAMRTLRGTLHTRTEAAEELLRQWTSQPAWTELKPDQRDRYRVEAKRMVLEAETPEFSPDF